MQVDRPRTQFITVLKLLLLSAIGWVSYTYVSRYFSNEPVMKCGMHMCVSFSWASLRLLSFNIDNIHALRSS